MRISTTSPRRIKNRERLLFTIAILIRRTTAPSFEDIVTSAFREREIKIGQNSKAQNFRTHILDNGIAGSTLVEAAQIH